VTFTGIEIETGTVSFAIEGVDVMPEDWIVVMASEKPFINVLWFGFIVLTVGMVISIVRRSQEMRVVARRKREALT
jgi:cytochrome c-type biogenesis protein CcmF